VTREPEEEVVAGAPVVDVIAAGIDGVLTFSAFKRVVAGATLQGVSPRPPCSNNSSAPAVMVDASIVSSPAPASKTKRSLASASSIVTLVERPPTMMSPDVSLTVIELAAAVPSRVMVSAC
jgi:hypothetical protein